MADVILLPGSGNSNDVIPRSFRTFSDAAASHVAGGGEAKYLPPIAAYFGGRPLGEIYPYDVRQMAETLYPNHSGATRNRQAITPARAVMYHASDRGWCRPIRIRSFKTDGPKRKRPASALWLNLFCRQCLHDRLPHVAALVLFMATTGARISEAIALRWSDVDLTARTALLIKTKTTGNSMRYLTDEVAERLRGLQDGQRRDARAFRYTSRFSVAERIKAVCRRAEIPYKSPHLCGRHTFATTAIDLGVDIGTAMAAGEWRSSKVFLETYVHPRASAGRLVADRMNLNAFGEM
ncbi:MAG: site-specific integrase [Ancalomicrobiaceae bacterium]|nr:site-specific integrase [Ancalomicrobiaceae bacterium]